MSCSNVLIAMDRTADCIPGLSIPTNLVNIFQKSVFLPCLPKSFVQSCRYYEYLQQKPYWFCILGLIPVIGNCTLCCTEYPWDWKQKEFVLDQIANYVKVREEDIRMLLENQRSMDWTMEHLRRMGEEGRRERDQERRQELLQLIDKDLWKDEEFVLSAVQIHPLFLSYASEACKANKEIAFIAACNGSFSYISEELKGDKEFILSVLKECTYDSKLHWERSPTGLIHIAKGSSKGMTVYPDTRIGDWTVVNGVECKGMGSNEWSKIQEMMSPSLRKDPEIKSWLSSQERL